MASKYGANDTVVGYITNVSNENKKKKYFVKFTMSSENNQIIDGWIFSSKEGILTTPLGVAMSNCLQNKTAIKLWGSMERNNDSITFRMQSWSKYQSINVDFQLQTPLNEILFIRDSLMSVDLNSIKVSIIGIRPSESFNSQGTIRTYTFVLIGDETGTTYLVAIDLPREALKEEYTYDITKVRRKSFNGTSILSTSIDTHISLSSSTITPDINDITTTMSINLTDIKIITTTVSEVGEIRRLSGCSTCMGELSEVVGAAALLCCTKCHRHVLKKNVVQHVSSSIVLKTDQENIILFVSDKILHKLIDLVGLNIDMINTDISIGVMSHGNLTFEYSELRKELLAISNPQ